MNTESLSTQPGLPRFLRWLCFGLAPLLTLPALAEDAEPETSELLDRIELRSVVSLPGETLFNLHDPESDLTFWIEHGQTRNEIQVVSFDAATNRVTLRHGSMEREVGLSRSRGPAAMEDPDENLSRREQREQRREERRQEFRDFRERWENAAENDPTIREITEHFQELQQEWQEVRREMRGVDRDSEEFDPIRERIRSLRDEQRLLSRYASQAITQTPGFTEEDVERANRMLQNDNRRRGN